ncbi:hypothetical protein DFJ73DRAFT_880662 [Zopfochytrium polystomum]|nr:hypothetical protein DFJ73DRAFT_880662 [Zopfochytrium polystomum]
MGYVLASARLLGQTQAQHWGTAARADRWRGGGSSASGRGGGEGDQARGRAGPRSSLPALLGLESIESFKDLFGVDEGDDERQTTVGEAVGDGRSGSGELSEEGEEGTDRDSRLLNGAGGLSVRATTTVATQPYSRTHVSITTTTYEELVLELPVLDANGDVCETAEDAWVRGVGFPVAEHEAFVYYGLDANGDLEPETAARMERRTAWWKAGEESSSREELDDQDVLELEFEVAASDADERRSIAAAWRRRQLVFAQMIESRRRQAGRELLEGRDERGSAVQFVVSR